jgi:hypothetical protein
MRSGQARGGLRRLFATLSLLAALLAGTSGSARAALLGNSLLEGKLYDIDPATGAATNPRSLGVDWSIAFSPNGTLYGVTQSGAGTPTPSALFTVNPATGAATLVATTSPSIDIEGDIAFDPTSGVLYAIDGGGTLFTIDTSTGVGTIVGTVSGALDLSAMAFDRFGNLFLVATSTMTLLRVDKGNAAVLGNVPLSPPPNGGVAGLSFDPASGTAYFANGSGTTNNLYTLNTSTGALTLVGPLTGTPDGLAGLAFAPVATSIPALNGWGTLALVGLTMLAGLALLERRRSTAGLTSYSWR